MLPKMTPTRSAIERLGPARFPGRLRRMEGQVKDGIEPTYKRRVKVQPREVERDLADEASARGINLVRLGNPGIERLRRSEQPAPRRHLGGRIDGRDDVRPETSRGRRRRGRLPRSPRWRLLHPLACS